MPCKTLLTRHIMQAFSSNPIVLPTHVIKSLSYRTLKPLESQRAALAAGKPAHVIHNGTTQTSLPKGFLQVLRRPKHLE